MLREREGWDGLPGRLCSHTLPAVGAWGRGPGLLAQSSQVFLNCSGHLLHVSRASEESPRASPSFLTDCPGRRCSSFPRLPPSAQGSWACVPATESGLPSRKDASRSAAQPHPGGKPLCLCPGPQFSATPRARVLTQGHSGEQGSLRNQGWRPPAPAQHRARQPAPTAVPGRVAVQAGPPLPRRPSTAQEPTRASPKDTTVQMTSGKCHRGLLLGNC